MIDELIDELIRTGRDITEDEAQNLRRVVGNLGFSPYDTMRAGTDLNGIVWQGRIIARNDQLPNDVRHYLKHVVAQGEWPSRTTIAEYVLSLREAVRDPGGGFCVDIFTTTWQLTFFGRSRAWEGQHGGEWILVGYNRGYGYWVTGFQPIKGLEHVPSHVDRLERRWLQRPS